MATYAIGDVQGCFDELQALLIHINFQPSRDILWFAGDLINRGPKSLDTLRFIKQLQNQSISVLGNHDLHCLSLYFTGKYKKIKKSHALYPLFQDNQCDELMHWLVKQPLLYHNPTHACLLVHAGIPPTWDLTTCLNKAKEIETLLQSKDRIDLLENMYGESPTYLTTNTSHLNSLRFTINSFTRMRLLGADQSLLLKKKGQPKPNKTNGNQPWFSFPRKLDNNITILFGHWAALEGQCPVNNIEALDTGCVWGKKLTAYCIETKQRKSVACSTHQ